MSGSTSRLTAVQDVRGSASKLILPGAQRVDQPEGFETTLDGMREIRKFIISSIEDVRYTVECAAARRMRRSDFEEVQAGAVVITAFLTEKLASLDDALAAFAEKRKEEQ